MILSKQWFGKLRVLSGSAHRICHIFIDTVLCFFLYILSSYVMHWFPVLKLNSLCLSLVCHCLCVECEWFKLAVHQSYTLFTLVIEQPMWSGLYCMIGTSVSWNVSQVSAFQLSDVLFQYLV